MQGHLIYEFVPAFWAALNATYYAGGRTTIDGERGQQLENVRLGLTAALSLSRHQSIKLYGSTGVYNRTDNDFWAVGNRLAIPLGWRAVVSPILRLEHLPAWVRLGGEYVRMPFVFLQPQPGPACRLGRGAGHLFMEKGTK